MLIKYIYVYNLGIKVGGCVSKRKRLFICSAIVGLSSLLYIDFYVKNLKFSFAAVVFPFLLYIHEDLNPVFFGFTSGIFLSVFRLIFYGSLQGILGQQFYYIMPEIVFYIIYGLVFYVVRKSNISMKYQNVLFISATCEFISNTVESYLRIGKDLFSSNYLIIKAFLLVAVIRGILVLLMVIGYNYYKLFLIKEEHEKRYRNLLQIISQLKAEVYWMEKNMDHIEKVMTNAYQLFSSINEEGTKENWAKQALEIAKDIHEIKKEYGLVVMGIEDVMANKLDNTGMKFNELVTILEKTIEMEVKKQNKDIQISYNIGEDFYTEEHYYLMSILRNLIINAIDSIKSKGNIALYHTVENNNHKFIVQDNGCGIKEEDLPYIFSPGYSSKIDYSTGQINRGLGLALVENIVKVNLKGSIWVKSEYGLGTTFTITIPVEELESEYQ